MKWLSASALLALGPIASLSFPSTNSTLVRRADPSGEPEAFQFALAVEHLQNQFYKTYLAKYSATSFTSAGYPSSLRGRMSQIAQHEVQHVALLTGYLGAGSFLPCTYTFPVNSVKDFVTLAQTISTLTTSAFIGDSRFITTRANIISSASILSNEARHDAWLNAVGLNSFPWSAPMDTPMSASAYTSIVAPFITAGSCPAANYPTFTTAYAKLTATVSGPSSAPVATLTYIGSSASGQYLALQQGTVTRFVAIANGKATLPAGLQGIVFAYATSDNTAPLTDTNILAGPAILRFEFDAGASNSGLQSA